VGLVRATMVWYIALSLEIWFPGITDAQDTQEGKLGSAGELSTKSSNPLGGDFMIWQNQFNLDWQDGDLVAAEDDPNSITHVFQPVMPFALDETLGENWLAVLRPTLSFVYSADQPSGPGATPATARFSNERGIGDLGLFGLVGQSIPQKDTFLGDGHFVWAAGVTSQVPIGSDNFSKDVWQVGPAGSLAFPGKDWSFAVLGQHFWDVADAGNNPQDINQTLMQLFYFRNLPGGWSIGGQPTIVYDWETDELTAPIGLGVSKVAFFGKLPIKLGIEVQYFFARPDPFGNELTMLLTFSPITPNFVANLLNGRPLMSVGGN